MKTVKLFVLTPSCICIIILLSCSVLICPSQTNSLFIDPFFFVRECKHHELIPNVYFTELLSSQSDTKCLVSWKFPVARTCLTTGLLFLSNQKIQLLTIKSFQQVKISPKHHISSCVITHLQQTWSFIGFILSHGRQEWTPRQKK